MIYARNWLFSISFSTFVFASILDPRGVLMTTYCRPHFGHPGRPIADRGGGDLQHQELADSRGEESLPEEDHQRVQDGRGGSFHHAESGDLRSGLPAVPGHLREAGAEMCDEARAESHAVRRPHLLGAPGEVEEGRRPGDHPVRDVLQEVGQGHEGDRGRVSGEGGAQDDPTLPHGCHQSLLHVFGEDVPEPEKGG